MNDNDSMDASSGENIGLYITEWRRKKDLKQGDLAQKLGMSAAQLCRLEKARHMPTFQTLRRLAEALDIDIQDLTRPPPEDSAQEENSMLPEVNEPIGFLEAIGIPDCATERPKTTKSRRPFSLVPALKHVSAKVPPRKPDSDSPANHRLVECKGLRSMRNPVRIRPLGDYLEVREPTLEPPKTGEHPFPAPVLETTEPILRGSWQARAAVKILEYRLAEKRANAPAKTSLPLLFPAEVASEDPEALARAVRTAGGIGVAPVPDAVSFLEDKGIRVIETALPPGTDSLVFWDEADHNAWLFLDRATTDERQQFRAATELGNLLMYLARGRKPIPDTPLARRFAKDFAAAFLMPDAALRELSYQLGRKRDDWTLDLVYHVKQRFGVSAEAFTYRLALLNLIRQSLKSHFIKEIKAWYDEHGHTEPHPSNRKGTRRSRYDNLLELAGKQ